MVADRPPELAIVALHLRSFRASREKPIDRAIRNFGSGRRPMRTLDLLPSRDGLGLTSPTEPWVVQGWAEPCALREITLVFAALAP